MPLNFGHSTVATPPSPATSGLSLTVTTGEGARFMAGPLVLCPEGAEPTPANAEIVTVESRAGDVLTLSARAVEGTTARTVVAGWRVLQGVTAALWNAVERDDLVADLFATTATWFIAHRGGGDEAPEHTMRAYLQGISRGYRAIEVSAQTTVDGTPICLHDTGSGSLSRTTTLSGEAAALPLSAITGLIVDSAATDSSNYALGAGYTALHEVPILGDVLTHAAHRCVVFLEPKTSTAAVLDALDGIPEPGKTIVWKYSRTGTTSPAAHAVNAAALGIRSWVYCQDNDTDQVLADTCVYADSVGIPLTATDGKITTLVTAALAAGIPVIVHPVRRRSEVARLEALGVDGMMCTNPSYAGTAVAHATSWPLGAGVRLPGDFWAAEARPGTYDPANAALLLGQGTTGGIVCGSMCPVPNPAGTNGGYKITFELKWATLPTGPTSLSGIYFGHASDESYQFQSATNQAGYHAYIRANGGVEIASHVNGTGTGTNLNSQVSATPVADTWMTFELVVTDTTITFTRTDVNPDVVATTNNTLYRGAYFGFHAGNTSVAPSIRNVVVTEL